MADRSPKMCGVEDCGQPMRARGWCVLHYYRWKRTGDPNVARILRVGIGINTCQIDGCERLVKSGALCSAHDSRARRHGSVDGNLKVCAICGAQYMARTRTRTCSPECSAELRLRYGRASRAEWRRANPVTPKVTEVKPCDACGKEFGANGRRSRYCSPECAESYKDKANWPYMVMRRARLRGATVERFDRAEIFERDGWVCQICDRPVDRTKTAPHPESPSLDHVIPLARGGEHSRANAQTAHLHCNAVKGVSVA